MSDLTIEAASVNLTSSVKGQYEATQIDVTDLSQPEGLLELDWSWGPVSVKGFLDTDSLDITVAPRVGGIYLGNLEGNLAYDFGIKINLYLYQGDLKWYLKGGNQLWTQVNIGVKYNDNFNEDLKITSW